MAKEQTFPHPPKGHVGLLAYDSVNDRWQVVHVDASGNLQVDSVSTALPTGAATSANQTTMITALQLIDDLRNALGSVDTDDLQVDIKTSALPSGAATSANQTTMITALQLIDDLRNALGSVNTDDLQVDVKTSGLPTGAATSANQTTMITALQLIDDLRAALADVGTDELRVNVTAELPAGTKNIGDVDVLTVPTTTVVPGAGEKLLGLSAIYEEQVYSENLAAGTNTLDGSFVPTGKLYVITHASMSYTGTPPTYITAYVMGLASAQVLFDQPSPVSAQFYPASVNVIMQVNDYIRLFVVGATAGDYAYLRVSGYQMDAP